MVPVVSGSFFQELRKLIDLPSDCVALTLHMRHEHMVWVECELYPDKADGPITKRYRLEEIEDA